MKKKKNDFRTDLTCSVCIEMLSPETFLSLHGIDVMRKMRSMINVRGKIQEIAFAARAASRNLMS